MKAITIFVAVLFCFAQRLNAQMRTISGRVVDEELEVAPGIIICNIDKSIIGTTDINGRFKIEVPRNTGTLMLGYLGMEWTPIKLKDDCDTVEVVMMALVTYDFISARKIDRLRLRRFNKLPELHLEAYKKGLFLKDEICYSREFKPEKPALDSIEKVDIIKEKQIKLTFKKFNIGDTVKIPFSGEYRADGTDRTTLSYYSVFASMKIYKYTVKVVIQARTGKNEDIISCAK